MDKLDLAKFDKTYFNAKSKPEIVEIGPAVFLSLTGKGDPSEQQFAGKVQAMYTIAYALKFSQKGLGKDFVVSKLEGLWWYDESAYPDVSATGAAMQIPRSEWFYRLLIRLPGYIGKPEIEGIRRKVSEKKEVAYINDVEHFTMNEGKCVQILHKGPFETEADTLAVVISFMEENKLHRNGPHHEIYLSDFRKTAPANLKTILREPVK